MQERGNRERRWLRLHAITAPIGVAAVTALLAWLGPSGDENQSAAMGLLDLAADRAYLATVIYALLAAIGEGGIRMVFWAWSEHQKAIQRFRDEGRAEGRAEAAKEYEPILAKEREARLAAEKEREAQLFADAVVKAVDARFAAAAREREDLLAAARERARADGVDLDKYLNP